MKETTMRAGVWTDTDQVETHLVGRPITASTEVLLSTTHVGICGSDLAIISGTHARAQRGIVLGHEFAGRVVTSPDEGLPVGRLVAVNPLISCQDRDVPKWCDACAAGHHHVCRHLGLYGVDVPGGLADQVAVPRHRVYPVQDDIPVHHAALAEPLAVAVHANARAHLMHGDRALVYGAGPIGLFTALVAELRGATDVMIVEANPWRRSVASDLGLTALTPQEALIQSRRVTDDIGADVVFDTAGVPQVAAQLSAAAKVRGRIMLVGVYKEPTELDLRAVNFSEQTLIGTRVYRDRDFAEAVRLINHRALPLDRVPVGEFPLERAQDAFEAARSGESLIKALITL